MSDQLQSQQALGHRGREDHEPSMQVNHGWLYATPRTVFRELLKGAVAFVVTFAAVWLPTMFLPLSGLYVPLPVAIATVFWLGATVPLLRKGQWAYVVGGWAPLPYMWIVVFLLS